MTPVEMLPWVYCIVDDLLRQLELDGLRQRGPDPVLSDSEVITMELVGEFLGYHTDTELLWYFRHHHLDIFPNLKLVHRTTFLRQAANLWAVKQTLHRHLVETLIELDCPWLIDSMPIPTCRFARAAGRKLYCGEARFGWDHIDRKMFYCWRPEIADHPRFVTNACHACVSVTPRALHQHQPTFASMVIFAHRVRYDFGVTKPREATVGSAGAAAGVPSPTPLTPVTQRMPSFLWIALHFALGG